MTNKHKKKYKALMLDVDGTLVINHPDALPSQKVIHAIERASKQVHVGVATGRPLFMVHKLLDHLSLSGPCIIDGGIRIIDAKSRKTLRQQNINTEDILPVITIAKKLGIEVDLGEEDKDVTFYEGYSLHKVMGLLTKPIDESLADIFTEQLLTHIPTISAYKTSSYTPNKVHVGISHASATKQHGILEVAQILGIETSEIIGVGDNHNDFPLLMACGLKVAMGNAVEDLKAIADYVAPTVEEDGVADVIEKFILK
ncbi:MAG TPA: HAD-IIB family hydrolase [Candidatus Saccharimonadales bacterium]|nr:HAD-IIB family hydrolase [Candidatus Saccharimonadales bacterium]